MLHTRRKWLLIAVLMLTLSMISGALLAAPQTAEESLTARLQRQSDGKVTVHLDAVTGAANYVESEKGALTREFAARGAAPESVARSFLAVYGDLFGVKNQATDLRVTSVKTDDLGQSHVRFAQSHGGLPVFGADLIVHLDRDGAVLAANGYIVGDLDSLSTQVSIAQDAAAKIAAGQVAVAGDAVAGESSLVILKPGLITDQKSENYLTYRFRVDSASQPELAKWVFVDAQTGDVRFSYPAVYEGRNRNTYNMQHGTNYGSATLARNEASGNVSSAPNCTAADVNNAHNYAGHTYDFYFNRFGRDSYNNAGATLSSYVCYGNNYQNAFWDGSRMTYGDGFAAADDVVSHELSHGVTEYASGLIYSYQSGALNESYSDIFGEAVDLTNASGNDGATVRWDMGEDIPGIGAIRDMADPGRFGDPDRTNSSNYYCGSGDNGGVHYNSGVPNKAFTLMVDGGTFNGQTVTAIGMDKAVQIQYRTNDVYLTSSSNMLANYNFLNRSCSDLIGQHGITAADCGEVRDALEAVKMNGPICGSGGATATPSGPTATPTPPGPTVTPTRTPTPGAPTATPPPATPPPMSFINGTFESGRNVGWAEYDNFGYQLVTSGSAYQGSWKAWLGGANNNTAYISQSVWVPSGSPTLYYRYRITSSDWCGYDYGRVQVNGTTIRTHNLCTSGQTSGYVQGSISFAAYAGQVVSVRFQATTDVSYTSSFYIDNVGFAPSLTAGTSDAAEPGETAREAKREQPAGRVDDVREPISR